MRSKTFFVSVTALAVLALVLAACAPAPTGPSATSPASGGTQPATVMLATSTTYGSYLTDAQGKSLYLYGNDTANTSTCSGTCLANWPALTVPAGTTPTAGPGVTGTLGTITRDDGSLQVTINGLPLYYFAKDTAAGDTKGQLLQNLWYLANASGARITTTPPAAEAAAPAASAATILAGNSSTYGAYLTDSKGMSVYLYTKDTSGVSNCTGNCATNWPPLTVPAGTQPTAGSGVTGTLGTITRADGTLQVTLNGAPLYYFVQDKAAGEMNGQGVNGIWFLVSPSGTAIASTSSGSG
ncbi:MAG: hypothetical protein ACYC6L_14710 [Anaerolineae bacterium]